MHITECDRCGQRIADAPNVRGVVVRRDYCADCVVAVDGFIAARSTLHTRLRREWDDALEVLHQDAGLTPEQAPD